MYLLTHSEFRSNVILCAGLSHEPCCRVQNFDGDSRRRFVSPWSTLSDAAVTRPRRTFVAVSAAVWSAPVTSTQFHRLVCTPDTVLRRSTPGHGTSFFQVRRLRGLWLTCVSSCWSYCPLNVSVGMFGIAPVSKTGCACMFAWRLCKSKLHRFDFVVRKNHVDVWRAPVLLNSTT